MIRPTTPNVLRVYRSASSHELASGRSWYADAHKLAERLDPGNVERAAGVLAALSPRVPWARNVMLAARAYADGHASGALGRNVRAADRILSGESPESVLTGPKVTAFYRAIVDPADPLPVVIDRHAFDVAVGRVTDESSRTVLARVGQYDRWARAYRRAAAILSEETGELVTPGQVQSVTWLAWRRQHRPGIARQAVTLDPAAA